MSFDPVTGSALVLAWLSFIGFLIFTWKQLNANKEAAATVKNAVTNMPASRGVGDIDIGKLLENSAKLVDSLAKAGPGLSALGASILFLAIAAYSGNKTDASAKPAPTETKQGVSGK
jgi:hypothetical protein